MAAPFSLDPVGLGEALAPFGHSRTLPSDAYRTAAVFEWEQAHLFEGGWVCVGRANDVRRSGEQRATTVGRSGVLLVRGDDARLRVFANQCRHRGHELLGCGDATRRRSIRCPYHGWIFALDGVLLGAPRFDGVPNFVPAEQGLVELDAAEWLGFVFVNVSGAAADFEAHVGELGDVLAPYELDRLVPAATHCYDVAANWKLVHENYHECYHCPSIHPELCKVTVAASGNNFRERCGDWVGGSLVLRDHAATMSFEGRAVGPAFGALDADRRRQVMYVSLLPDLLISAHPDYVMTHRLVPLSHRSTMVECQWLFPPEVVHSPGFDASGAVGLWDVTNREDWAAVESVQRGIESPLHRPGVLARHEDAVYEVVVRLANAYRDALGN